MLSPLNILPRLFIACGLLVLLIAGLSALAILSNQSLQALSAAALRLKTAASLDQRLVQLLAMGSVNRTAENTRSASHVLDAARVLSQQSDRLTAEVRSFVVNVQAA